MAGIIVGAGAALMFETDGEGFGRGLLIAGGVQQFVVLVAFSLGPLLDEIVPGDAATVKRPVAPCDFNAARSVVSFCAVMAECVGPGGVRIAATRLLGVLVDAV